MSEQELTPDQLAARKRRQFQRIKSMTQAQFFNAMDILFSDAYVLAEKHYREAMEIELQPKQRQKVEERVKLIRELWDGITLREDLPDA